MSTRRDFLRNTCFSSAAAMGMRLDLLAMSPSKDTAADALPGEYFRRMSKWCSVVQTYLQGAPEALLSDMEKQKGWYHLPYTVLPAALLYAKSNPMNPHYRKRPMLELAMQLGDLLVREDSAGTFSPRLDSYRDVSLWLEAYALVKTELGVERERAWKVSMERNVGLLVPELIAWKDVAAYTENFLGTSPNHFAWWAATVMTAGLYLDKPEWKELGKFVLGRFATTEQNPDGYWGEHNPNGPTGGYNYLTTMAVGLYWEHTQDAKALEALGRATTFHTSTTYGDGNLSELFNDRNRYWEVSPWGQFAFSHFPQGRSYAQMLTSHIPDDEIDLDTLGMLGQNALYYHSGPAAPCPQQREAYAYRLISPAGLRKTGPWTVALSGIVDTPPPRSQWFLDRQANLSVFHEREGLILCGANSKHQPELATFAEKLADVWETTPKGGRLEQSASGDKLAVAHNSFSAEIIVAPAKPGEIEMQFCINGRGPVPEEAYLGLQLRLKPGNKLESAGGKSALIASENIQWDANDIGGELRSGGWTLKLDAGATLQWPVFPYNPYRNGPETKLEHAVALLRVPLNLHVDPNHWLQLNEKTIRLRLTA